MIGKKVEKAINEQINKELYSAYLYHAMEAYFSSINLKGAANWMRIQAMEEMTHATKFFGYIDERGGKVELDAIAKPPKEWDSPLAVFQAAYEHETKVTESINNIVNLAISEKDHATVNFLQWFVNEQVEEEASADAVVQQMKLAKDAPGALFMIDKELAARVFVPPASKAE